MKIKLSIFFLITLFSLSNSMLFAEKSPNNEDLLKIINQNIKEKIEKLLQQESDQKNKTKSSAVEFEQYLQNNSSMNTLKKRMINGSRINIFELFPLQNNVTKKMEKNYAQLTNNIKEYYYLNIAGILVSTSGVLLCCYTIYNNKEVENKCNTANYNSWQHTNKNWINKNSAWVFLGYMPHNPSFSNKDNDNLNLFIRRNTHYSINATLFALFIGAFTFSLNNHFNGFVKKKEKENNQRLLIKIHGKSGGMI